MADRDSLHVAVDEFIGMRPEGAEFDEAWFPVRQINHSEPVLPRIVTGIDGEKLPAAVQQRIGDLSAKRLPVIADKVSARPRLATIAHLFGSPNLIAAKLTASPPAMRRREIARYGSLMGLADEQATNLLDGIAYDPQPGTELSTPTNSAPTADNHP